MDIDLTLNAFTRPGPVPEPTGEVSDVGPELVALMLETKPEVVLCQEGARAPCCTRDEGGPFGAVL